MTRVVLDVNVIVSGFPIPNSVPGTLVRMGLEERYDLVVSEHIVQGAVRAWRKPYFRTRFDEERADASVQLLRQAGIFVEPEFVAGIAPDLEDDLILGTALAGGANYLVTGDRGLLQLHAHREVLIISPQEFLAVLAGASVSSS